MNSGATIERLSEAARALKSGDDRAVLRAARAAQNALDAVMAEALHSLKTSDGFELDGASTVTTWARNELRMNAPDTNKLLAAASTARDLPAVAEAAAQGKVSLDHVATFTFGLKHIDAEIVRESEGWLLDVALSCEPTALRTVMRDLREAVYPDSLDEAWARGMDKQDFQVSPVPEGWHVNGFLNIVTGSKLDQVLGALGAPSDKDDDRPGSERRVAALDDLLDSVLASGLPSDKGVRPHLSVIVDAETLHASANRLPGFLAPAATPARLAGFGPIGPKLLDYLGCISDATGILTTGGEAATGPDPERRALPPRRHAQATPRHHRPSRRRVRRTWLPSHASRDTPQRLVVARWLHRPRPDGRPVRPVPPPASSGPVARHRRRSGRFQLHQQRQPAAAAGLPRACCRASRNRTHQAPRPRPSGQARTTPRAAANLSPHRAAG